MSINKVILVGNVGKDPDVKYLDRNVAVANFSLATTERGFTGKDGVQVPDRTEWHNIVAWRGLAELAEKYIKKGSQIYIEGKIRTRNYDDQNGVKRYMTEIFADAIQLLGKKDSGSDSDNATEKPTYSQPGIQEPQKMQEVPQASNAMDPSNAAAAQVDDLPF